MHAHQLPQGLQQRRILKVRTLALGNASAALHSCICPTIGSCTPALTQGLAATDDTFSGSMSCGASLSRHTDAVVYLSAAHWSACTKRGWAHVLLGQGALAERLAAVDDVVHVPPVVAVQVVCQEAQAAHVERKHLCAFAVSWVQAPAECWGLLEALAAQEKFCRAAASAKSGGLLLADGVTQH